MQVRLLQKFRDVTASFWFIPTLLTVAGISAAALTLHLDMKWPLQQWAEQNPVLFTSGEGARTLLATLAGSSISVAGVIFSITIVVLNMAAAQFGPGLLGRFMHHRGTQIVMGAFVATFTYSMVVMRFVDDEAGFVPHIAANFGLLLGLLSFFLLIYFINHVSMFVQVARVIEDVASKLEQALRKEFPERENGDETGPDEELNIDPEELRERAAVVVADQTGYLQAIDGPELLKIANDRKLQIRLNYRPGHFVIQGAAFALVTPAERLDDNTSDAIRQHVAFGPERSLAQDPEFAIHQLVEIALRSLSPAVNDPFTVVNCLDRLAGSLALLGSRRLQSRCLRNDKGDIRVIINPITYAGIVDATFSQIRQLAHGKAAVIFRMLELIAELGRRDIPESFRNALDVQRRAIRQAHNDAFTNDFDREQYLARLKEAEQSILRIGD